jgi:hypothetical protein
MLRRNVLVIKNSTYWNEIYISFIDLFVIIVLLTNHSMQFICDC